MEQTKLCTKCKALLPLECFNKKKSAKDGRRSRCRKCQKEEYETRKALDPEKERARLRKWKHDHPDRVSANSKKRRDADWDHVREIEKASHRKHRDKNRDKLNARRRATRKKVNDQRRHRYATDADFRLTMNLRSRFKMALKHASATKSDSVIEIMGCSVSEFKKHIESLWKPGMRWENYRLDGWHIDHMQPLASFNLKDPEQQKLAFHYTNAQPLWAHENLIKGSTCPTAQSVTSLTQSTLVSTVASTPTTPS